MQTLNEQLLAVWLGLSSAIRNDRVVTAMSFNEIHICNQLYRAQIDGGMLLTATDLCKKTGLLKSQMNKVLKGLEKENYIIRERSTEDRRKVYIRLNMDKISVYEAEHERILKFVDVLITQIGEEDIKEAVRIMRNITEKATDIFESNLV